MEKDKVEKELLEFLGYDPKKYRAKAYLGSNWPCVRILDECGQPVQAITVAQLAELPGFYDLGKKMFAEN